MHLNEIAISAAAFLAVSIRRLRECARFQLRHDSSNSFQASKPSAARNSWVNSDLRYNADEPAIYSVFGERSNKHLDRQHTFLRK